MSAPTIASFVFFAFSLIAATAVQYLLRTFAEEAGVNPWVFIMVPALFAMLYALILYQGAERTVRRLGESVSRGILIALMTWISFSAMATWAWCEPHQIGQCFSNTLLVSGIVGGGPMLAAALLGGILTGVLIIRPPRRTLEE